jgi:hypothetical protein
MGNDNMEKDIKVVVVNVGEQPEVKVVPNKLETFQSIVGGYIEVIRFGSCLCVLNEEGKLDNLEPNFTVPNDVIVGNVVFVGNDGEDFCSLSDGEIDDVIGYVNNRRAR